MRALGLVNRTVREINEMRYEFDEPFIVDASRAETELGLRATPLTDAVEQTVRWYRSAGDPVVRRRPERHADRHARHDPVEPSVALAQSRSQSLHPAIVSPHFAQRSRALTSEPRRRARSVDHGQTSRGVPSACSVSSHRRAPVAGSLPEA